MFTKKPQVIHALSEIKFSTDTVKIRTPSLRPSIFSMGLEMVMQVSDNLLTQELAYLKDALRKENDDVYPRHLREQRKLLIEITLLKMRKKTSLREVIECLHELFIKNGDYSLLFCTIAGVTLGAGRLSVNLHDHIKMLAQSGGFPNVLSRQKEYEFQLMQTISPSSIMTSHDIMTLNDANSEGSIDLKLLEEARLISMELLSSEVVFLSEAQICDDNHLGHLRAQRKLFFEIALLQIEKQKSYKNIIACLDNLFEKNNAYFELYCTTANLDTESYWLPLNYFDHGNTLAQLRSLDMNAEQKVICTRSTP